MTLVFKGWCFIMEVVSLDIVVLKVKADFYALNLGVEVCFFCFMKTKCRGPPLINLKAKKLIGG